MASDMVADRNQHTNYCFTFNFGDPSKNQPMREHVDRFIEYAQDHCKYLVAGFEVAPTTGQVHLQGYIQLKKRARITELKKWPEATTVYWAVAKGDEVENRDYCLGLKPPKTPTDDFVEYGEPIPVNPGGRERQRWANALAAAKAGRFCDIDPQIYLCQLKNVHAIHDRHAARVANLPPGTKHFWFWGNTGTGKSRLARESLDAAYPEGYYVKTHNKWWDHYEHGQGAIIDDLGLDCAKALTDHLKQWLDMYKLGCDYKGGIRQIRPPVIYITSNYHPWEIWGGTKDYDPIMRRLNVRWFGSPGETEPNMGVADLVLPDVVTPVIMRSLNPVSTGATTVVVNPVHPDHQEVIDISVEENDMV